MAVRTFRAHVSAAPLKPAGPNAARGNRSSFRAHVSAAPLKLEIIVRDHQLIDSFPRSRERGPVEARPASSSGSLSCFLSALT